MHRGIIVGHRVCPHVVKGTIFTTKCLTDHRVRLLIVEPRFLMTNFPSATRLLSVKGMFSMSQFPMKQDIPMKQGILQQRRPQQNISGHANIKQCLLMKQGSLTIHRVRLLIIKGTTATTATLREILTNHRVRLHRQDFTMCMGILSGHRVRLHVGKGILNKPGSSTTSTAAALPVILTPHHVRLHRQGFTMRLGILTSHRIRLHVVKGILIKPSYWHNSHNFRLSLKR